ncbi:PadR family transcriptional regulator [Alkalihalobacterium alkalinitrilicum]|uniref:PadR family transcriptional regulator n=1 Tax=Alkalihalobacterium alkalinitrilicum TaxID=427920 RepID=UPI001303DB4B|nr:PadR family transcriptional regulator [Alkalihalobacterium alkalinitrilicum]
MEDRLKGLKKALKHNVFHNVSFSEERRQAVKETIQAEKDPFKWDETTVLVLLNTINDRSLTGFQIAENMSEKDDHTFKDQEGRLYTLLHRLEQKRILRSEWKIEDDKNRKYYSLSSIGKRILASKAKEESGKSFVLKEVLEGGSA